jgi:hypothetical protein
VSIASVATRGYGTWGSVNLVVTLGYGIGAAVLVQPVDGAITQTHSRVAITETQNRVWIVSAK